MEKSCSLSISCVVVCAAWMYTDMAVKLILLLHVDEFLAADVNEEMKMLNFSDNREISIISGNFHCYEAKVKQIIEHTYYIWLVCSGVGVKTNISKHNTIKDDCDQVYYVNWAHFSKVIPYLCPWFCLDL